LSDAAGPRFAVPLRAAMKREGLAGATVSVSLDGDVLVLTGEGGGLLRVPAAEVERLRIATVTLPPPRHSVRPPTTLYEARIWRTGHRGRLLIGPSADRPHHYRSVMREYAGWVFAGGGEVLRGPGLGELVLRMAWAIVPLGLLGLLLLGGAVVEGLAWLWLLAASVLAAPIFLARRIRRRHWPRRVESPEALDDVLPPLEEKER
jgi:hypothetical protein